MRSGGFLIWEAAAGRLELEGICSIKIPETIDNFDFGDSNIDNLKIQLFTKSLLLLSMSLFFLFALVFEFQY